MQFCVVNPDITPYTEHTCTLDTQLMQDVHTTVHVQDTRRLLQSEATALSAELKRRQAAARLAGDKNTAAQLGLGDLGRLGERLAGEQRQHPVPALYGSMYSI
jgi:hypothetical protein